MRPHRHARHTLATLTTVLLTALAGCAESAPDTASTGDTVALPPDAAATAPSPDTMAFEGTTARTEHASTGDSVATLTAVRSAERSGGHERVVFEFAGGAVPGYTIEYTDTPPAQCGSGETVEVAGRAWLVVRMQPAQAHRAGPGEQVSSTIAERDRRGGTGAVRQLKLICDFEAMVTWVLGIDQRRPYRAFTLRSPARLVVDVETGA